MDAPAGQGGGPGAHDEPEAVLLNVNSAGEGNGGFRNGLRWDVGACGQDGFCAFADDGDFPWFGGVFVGEVLKFVDVGLPLEECGGDGGE